MSTPDPAPAAAVLRKALRLTIVTAVLVALIVVATTSQWGLWWRLITFTYQANLLAAAYYLWTLARPRADARVGLRGAVVLYVVTAGVVWNLFLTGHSMGYTVANLLLHVVVPVLVLADWLLVGRGASRVAWWQPLAWLIYPAGYLALALLVLNTAGRRAPYFFLDPATVGSATVALNVGTLAACVLALGYLLLAAHRAAVPLRTESP
ncbi:Pr6Pr family membrane protein [Mycobacterium sp. Y57]|nr:Pr6Pr family membrane protein [Mycolicibacterium xanthum]MBX7434527.1 Pr6Pr family membrane protein [Mycolicibacterium xanthum]